MIQAYDLQHSWCIQTMYTMEWPQHPSGRPQCKQLITFIYSPVTRHAVKYSLVAQWGMPDFALGEQHIVNVREHFVQTLPMTLDVLCDVQLRLRGAKHMLFYTRVQLVAFPKHICNENI